jgi:hypothetical protein
LLVGLIAGWLAGKIVSGGGFDPRSPIFFEILCGLLLSSWPDRGGYPLRWAKLCIRMDAAACRCAHRLALPADRLWRGHDRADLGGTRPAAAAAQWREFAGISP